MAAQTQPLTRGTMIRDSTHSTAIVMDDRSLLEVKRDHQKGLKNKFATVEAWAASLGTTPATLTYEQPRAGRSARPTKLERVFRYEVGCPQWQIAKDLLDHFNTKIRATYRFEPVKNLITKVQIKLLKLELDPPEFEGSWATSVEHARGYHEVELQHLRARLEQNGDHVASQPSYCTYISNPHVFIKKGDTMLPLGYNEQDKVVVVRGQGYRTFQDYTQTPSEFWALWQGKLTKLRVEGL